MARKNSLPSSPPLSESDDDINDTELAYDPNQDPDEKRDIRRNMRANISEANGKSKRVLSMRAITKL